MANLVENVLIQPLFDELQKQRFVTLTTIDHETGIPNVNAISWTVAKDESTIVFTVASRSKIVENIRQSKYVVITLIANESTYSISGEAVVKQEQLEGVNLKLSLIELQISEVRDVMFYGARITSEPQYEFTYDKTAADTLDIQVMEAMKKA
ncbi:pyridoxamine 5'-phosphate oxidase family protein [Bacillus massiliigorillae]|uniref:pyridoxamine 5'-phosphate oxidase family protein n=1 Tax=Bacillus massiliigorillae TaxID=1243664 RepID=UPI00039F5B42|nr:pyridoxamine 5'-phosphate oxidase family protein [Bacillus massiliigorillae]